MILSKDAATPEALAAEARDIARRFTVGHLDELQYFPQFVQIETTRLCNAHCPFCPIDVWDKSTPFMSDELFKKVADEVIEHRDWVKWVCLQREGEPLLDKKIYDRVRYMKDGGIRFVTFSTNASALTEQNAHKVLEAGIDEINFSIESVEKERYEAMRVGLKYEQVIANIRRFFALRDELRPQTVVRVRAVSFHDLSKPEDRADIERWKQFWDDLRKPQDRIYMMPAHNWGNQKELEGHSPEYNWVYHPCVIPFSTIQITAMGKVALCCNDYDAKIEFGDVTTQSIVDVWQGEKIQAMRKIHLSGERNQVSLCQGCRQFEDAAVFEAGNLKSEKPLARELVGVRRPAQLLA